MITDGIRNKNPMHALVLYTGHDAEGAGTRLPARPTSCLVNSGSAESRPAGSRPTSREIIKLLGQTCSLDHQRSLSIGINLTAKDHEKHRTGWGRDAKPTLHFECKSPSVEGSTPITLGRVLECGLVWTISSYV